MGRRLLPEVTVKLVAAGAQEELALTVALTHHRGDVVVNDVFGREVHSLVRFRGFGNDKINHRAFGHSAGPLYIQVGLRFLIRDTRVGAVENQADIRIELGAIGRLGEPVDRQTKLLAKIRNVGGVDVCLGDDGDLLAGAVSRNRGHGTRTAIGKGCIPQGQNVVDCGEITGTERVERAISARIGKQRRDRTRRLSA